MEHETHEVVELGGVEPLEDEMHEVSVAGGVFREAVVEVRQQPTQQSGVFFRAHRQVAHDEPTQILLPR